ncbi:MAG: heme-binding protein, partial [Usitatibacter sp.]
MRTAAGRALAAAISLAAAACGGGGGGGGASTPAPCAECTSGQPFLAEADVQQVIAQAVGEAQARGVHAHIAIVDRVGNVLAVFRMTGAPATVAISSGLGVSGGLDGIPAGTIPAEQAAIA